jgi:hypothetical protein
MTPVYDLPSAIISSVMSNSPISSFSDINAPNYKTKKHYSYCNKF